MDEIRLAASVIAARDADDGPEVLVVERSGASRFLPGYVVFPGGAVDATDHELATRWFGDPREAARATAVRELVEEVGLAVTAAGVVPADGADPLAAVDATPPPAAQLVQLARWVAPEEVPVRFDARFFGVEVAGRPVPAADGVEAADAWWVSPRRLLEEWEAGERKLYWPTWFTVRSLAARADARELLALAIETREPDDDEVASMPPSVFWQDR